MRVSGSIRWRLREAGLMAGKYGCQPLALNAESCEFGFGV